MAGITAGPGEGKNPKDRNDFVTGPYNVDPNLEIPQIRQKSERSYAKAEEVQVEAGSKVYQANLASYNSLTRQGTATLPDGQTVNIINASKLSTVPGDVVLVAEVSGGSFAMVGLLTQAENIIAPSFPSGSIDTSYPVNLSDGVIVYPISAISGSGTRTLVDRGGQSGFGLLTVFGASSSSFSAANVHGASVSTGGNFTLGRPGDFQPTALGFDSGNVVIGGSVASAPQITHVWSPGSGWNTYTTPDSYANSNTVYDVEAENTWQIMAEIGTNQPRFFSIDGGVPVDRGPLGLSANLHTFVTASNGKIVMHRAGQYFYKSSTDTSSFTAGGVGGAVLPGIRVASALSLGVWSATSSTATTFGDVYFADIASGVTVVYTDVLPLDFYVKTVQEGASGGLIIVGYQATNLLPDPPSRVSHDVSLAVYGFDGVSTSLLFYDFNNHTSASATTTPFSVANIATRANSATRVDGDFFFWSGVNTGVLSAGFGSPNLYTGFLYRFNNL
jgi:hypothetical protein